MFTAARKLQDPEPSIRIAAITCLGSTRELADHAEALVALKHAMEIRGWWIYGGVQA